MNKKQSRFKHLFNSGRKCCKKGKPCLRGKRAFIAGYAYQYELEAKNHE